MFGWEFPPAISGGLGTACFGLTQALGQDGVHVIFVAPKLVGKSEVDNVDLVSVDDTEYIAHKNVLATEEQSSTETNTVVISGSSSITKVAIDADLLPYEFPSVSHSHRVEQWNYSLQIQQEELVTVFGQDLVTETTRKRYQFTGGYGKNLMLEVQRFKDAGAALTEQYDFDVIHAHDWMTFPAGVEGKKRTGKPLVLHVHATEHDRTTHPDPKIFAIEQESMKSADQIVAVSQWTKNIIISKYGISASKVTVVHNGILETSRKQERRMIAPVGSRVVTFLGRITYQKGPSYFVKAAKKVIQQFPDVHFVMAGSGDLFPQTIEEVARLGLSLNFHFTGFLRKNQIDQVLSYSDVYVMPSVSEPFGITPLEAIQAGVPVIISNQSGVSEVMPHALKVDFWDSEALANAICSVLKYESLSKVLRDKSFRETKKITWQRTAKKIKDLYNELHAEPII